MDDKNKITNRLERITVGSGGKLEANVTIKDDDHSTKTEIGTLNQSIYFGQINPVSQLIKRDKYEFVFQAMKELGQELYKREILSFVKRPCC